MLGRTILDPQHVESSLDAVAGLGLLDCSTVFQTCKETARVEGVHLASGAKIAAYEIHMGCTQGIAGALPLFKITHRHGLPAEGYDGVSAANGRVWGTYLHGLFDSEEFRRWWLERLRPGTPVPKNPSENRFDALADAVRKSIDVDQLYRIVLG
jgi:adenosylcobyric acid synthase